MLLRWVPIQHDGCPSKKKKFGHRHRHTQREDDVKTQGEESTSKPSRETWTGSFITDIRKNRTYQHLEFGLLASRLWENTFLSFKPPKLWYFFTAAPANQSSAQMHKSHSSTFPARYHYGGAVQHILVSCGHLRKKKQQWEASGNISLQFCNFSFRVGEDCELNHLLTHLQ